MLIEVPLEELRDLLRQDADGLVRDLRINTSGELEVSLRLPVQVRGLHTTFSCTAVMRTQAVVERTWHATLVVRLWNGPHVPTAIYSRRIRALADKLPAGLVNVDQANNDEVNGTVDLDVLGGLLPEMVRTQVAVTDLHIGATVRIHGAPRARDAADDPR